MVDHRQKGALGIFLLTLIGVSGCREEALNADDGPPVARSAECRFASGRIKIDGNINEIAWEKAEVLDNFAVFWEKRKPKTATKARLLWDDKFFYFSAEMEDTDLYADLPQAGQR